MKIKPFYRVNHLTLSKKLLDRNMSLHIYVETVKNHDWEETRKFYDKCCFRQKRNSVVIEAHDND